MMKNKVVYNSSGFGLHLSDKAVKWLKDRGYKGDIEKIPRHDQLLIDCIETLGDEANGKWSSTPSLHIIEIEGNTYRIRGDVYDCAEEVEFPDEYNKWIIIK